jgi:uncharacterized phiE125 gp8 family phage protein
VTLVQPPFWAHGTRQGVAPHAVSVLVTPPESEPIDLATAKLYARLTGTDLDGLIPGFITSARMQVEQETGLALIEQTRDVSYDAIAGPILTLPSQSRPLQSVTSITSTDSAGAEHVLDPANYVVDLASARIGLAIGGAWASDLRPFRPYVIRIVSGWATPEAVPQPLKDAVGFFVDYLVNKDAMALQLYEQAIANWRPVVVA